MSRNMLKSFPTAILRAGLVHFHPGSRPTAQPTIGRDDSGRGRRRAPHASPRPPAAPVASDLETLTPTAA
jgi:hypothetical protein